MSRDKTLPEPIQLLSLMIPLIPAIVEIFTIVHGEVISMVVLFFVEVTGIVTSDPEKTVHETVNMRQSITTSIHTTRGSSRQQVASNYNQGSDAKPAPLAFYISVNALTTTTANMPLEKAKWIIDNGASDKLTPDRRAFRHLHTLLAPIPVYIGDGTKLYPIARRTVQLRSESVAVVEIEGLYVPKLRYYLISVACLCQK
ncbi:hypothetical protein HOY80DRAFT_1040715 [Tuber brumale]|nr:hypothetical protein HOY80DRAFT_1040715 [Tuber brumale]